ncbi:patatin-like phospholipase family protein [Pyruvatibacter mobilis]|jgi:NTE family protein|uniref:NTE family protein rssA n=1 Tax=Pyruvatibacter mobilis TaxID=1712261 RepID=A0A845QGW9_9HYPH|nr:patatin-like phospholipase family protein [Pyruvatibacter mobilis]NBG96871.1 NTE family protein rssA [Pyruvatibacter mobilis]QJD74749.1 NTE family protein rssA [Pyruvatibacter mobilis]GGD09792.1 phospholipase [Pyruvatibacter mobilis]
MTRPKIGLALGGGVARGWAHIGIMRVLMEEGIRPDIIAGTSIGAVVGGCYSAGKLDALEDWARSLTPRRMLGLLDLNFGGAGLLSGMKLAKLLEENIGDIELQHLGTRFVAVATELATGHEIWLRDGPLVPALRASYALPAVFNPINIEERWLVDGALVNPVPASVCRAFGARLVIAVSLGSDTYGLGMVTEGDKVEGMDFGFEEKREGRRSIGRAMVSRATRPDRELVRQLFGWDSKTPGITTVMMGALNIIQDRLARMRLAGDPPDVMMAPRIGHIALSDFHRASECIKIGEDAARQAIPVIREAMEFLGGKPDMSGAPVSE